MPRWRVELEGTRETAYMARRLRECLETLAREFRYAG